MPNNLMQNLNPEQLKAVLHKDGPLLIVAGAGTGKTTAITQKIAYMIEQSWAKSDEILALTFTEKAAGEMEERADRLLPIGYLDLWIFTFHGFAEKILKTHGIEIGLPGEFKLLNEFEQWILIQKNLDRFDLSYYKPLGNPTKFITALLKHFSRLKDEDISPTAYLDYADGLKQNLDGMLGGTKKNQKSKIKNQNDPPASLREAFRAGNVKLKNKKAISYKLSATSFETQEIAQQEMERVNEVANAYHIYQQLLLENSALDFGDLINHTLKLFRERPHLLKKYREQFKYILVDEFQDTNWAQYELVKLLAGDAGNLIVVGDDDQSIYRFRGASMSNILQFKKDFSKAKEIVLVKNYRSRQNILDLSYEFIKLNNPNRLEWQLQSSRLDKKLTAQIKGEGEIEVIRAEDLAGEVRAVVEKIISLKKRDKEASWNDFAILVRANDHAKEFLSVFDAAGLPYQFLASRGLYAKPIIMDTIAYFKLLDDYHESTAMYRVLNLPMFNFTHREITDLNYWAGRKAWSLFETLRNVRLLDLGEETRKKADSVLALLAKHAALVRDRSVSQIFIAFLNDSGYLKILSKDDDQKNRESLGYLNQFMKRIRAFEAGSDDKSVKDFLSELEMEIEAGEAGALAPDSDAGPEMIKLMTAHGAKGLEFKYVFIANLVDRRFPTDERKEQIEIPAALIKEILPEGDAHLEEERRLFYVAMTRARDGLYFSWAPDYGGTRKKKPSRFLLECGLVDPSAVQSSKNHGNKRIVFTDTEKREEGGKGEKREEGGKGEKREEGERGEKKEGTEGVKGEKGGGEKGEGEKRGQTSFTEPSPLRISKTAGREEFLMPQYFSYTQLAAFSNCPYQYRFAHILRIPIKGKSVFSFGKTMHSTLQKIFELVNERRGFGQSSLFGDGQATPSFSPRLRSGEANGHPSKEGNNNPKIALEEIYKLFDENWIDDWYESKKEKENYRQKGKDSLKIFFDKHKNDWPETVFIEKGFKLKIHPVRSQAPAASADTLAHRTSNGLNSNGTYYTVRGVIDRIDKTKNGIRLIDYKTGQPKSDLSFEEKEQLLIYQLAAKDVFREEVTGLTFYYLDDNSEVEFIGSTAELGKIKEKMLKTIDDIKKGQFPARPSKLCRWCDFFDICEYRQG
jgi:DNA helicase-2/ATP-dependent DNA helicase PcrA